MKPQKLKGFQDYDPAVMKRRHMVMDSVRKTADLSGFSYVSTPALEYAETLLGEGGETDKQVYKFEDGGGREVALRFDLTVPFARYASEHYGKYSLPFKRVQIGDVWRAEKPQKGRYREFCQCDFDIIGLDSKYADLEVALALSRTLEELSFGQFTISFGHRVVLSELIKVFLPETLPSNESGSNADVEAEILIAIDKLDKIGPQKVIDLIETSTGFSRESISKLIFFINDFDDEHHLTPLKKLLGTSETAAEGLESLLFVVSEVNNFFGSKSSSYGKAKVDLKIARGLAYYTGIVFETTIDQLPSFGSISSGGRYNNLTQRFSTQSLPGVGGSIGLDRLVAAFEELERSGQANTPFFEALASHKRRGSYIVVADEVARAYALSVCHKLRAHGISCEIDMKSAKLNKQFQLADKLLRKHVIVLGRDEWEKRGQGIITLKDLETGSQESIRLNDALPRLQS